MRDASYDSMNGASADQIRDKYESKGNALSSLSSGAGSSFADKSIGTVAGQLIKDSYSGIARGGLAPGFEMAFSASGSTLASFGKTIIGTSGTIVFFWNSSQSTLNKYGSSWNGGGKRVAVDAIFTGLSVAAGIMLIPASAALVPTVLAGMLWEVLQK